MSISRYVDVWCDNEECAVWEDRATSKTAAEARRIAKACGWIRTADGRDLCPNCAAKYKAGELP